MSVEAERLRYRDKIGLISRDARLTIVRSVFYAFAFGINDVLFNLYLLEAGYGEDFLGFFLSISMFLTGGLAILAGIFADRHSRKKILLVSNVVILIAFVIQYSTLTPIYLLISQLLIGFGYAFNGVCLQPYTISVTTEEERVHVFSVRYAFFLVASLLGSLVGGFLPTLFSSLGLATNILTAYRLSLWFALIPIGLSVIVIVPMTTDRVEKKRSFGFANVIHRSFIGKYALAWTISGLGAGLFVHFFNVFFNLAFAADEVTIGIIFAINTIVMAAGNFTSPTIVDKFGKLGTIIWFQIFSLPFLFLLSWSPVLYIGVIGFVSRALFINIAWPVMEVYYMEGLEPQEQATAMGVINTGDSIGRAFGLNIAGVLLASGFLRMPYFIGGVLYAVSILLFVVFFGGETEEDSENKVGFVTDGKEN